MTVQAIIRCQGNVDGDSLVVRGVKLSATKDGEQYKNGDGIPCAYFTGNPKDQVVLSEWTT